MKLLKYFLFICLALASVLTLPLLLPARLSLSLFYEAYIEYLIYLNLVLTLCLFFYKTLNTFLRFLFIAIALFFQVKYLPIFFTFYNGTYHHKEELNQNLTLNKRINFINSECLNFNEISNSKNTVFNFSSNEVNAKNADNIIIKKKEKIYIDKDVFLKAFEISAKDKINLYFIDFKNIKSKDLISRRISSYLRHSSKTIIYIKNFSTPFSLVYRSFAKGSDFYNVLQNSGYPFFSGTSFKNHLFISKDIISNVDNFELNYHFSIDL